MLIAFSLAEDFTIVKTYSTNGRRFSRRCGKLNVAQYKGMEEVIAETFGSSSVPQLAELTSADYIVDREDNVLPDLELLGEDGDPGDRILPEELVRTDDSVQDEGLGEDVIDLPIRGKLPSVDGEVYRAYFVTTVRNAQNPYGSKNSFAGLPEAVCPFGKGNCLRCAREAQLYFAETPCARILEKHPYTWEDSNLRSPDAFFQIVSILPRYVRPGQYKTFYGRDGKKHTVPMKNAPVVIVRWGDIDDAGNFVPGVVDEQTGERRERYSLMPAWALYNIKTGERFQYKEPERSVRLNAPLKQRVLAEARKRYPGLFQGVIHPKRDLGVAFWKLDIPEGNSGVATLRAIYPNGQRAVVRIEIIDGTTNFRPQNGLERFALQALIFRVLEAKMLQALGRRDS